MQLYDALKTYCIEALALLQTEAAQLPTTGPGQYIWSDLTIRLSRRIVATPQHEAAIHAMLADEATAMHLKAVVGTGEMRNEAQRLLRSLILQLIHELEKCHGFSKSCEFDEGVFRSVYQTLEHFLHTSYREMRCLCPLFSFQMDGDRVSLDTDLALVRVAEEERFARFEILGLVGLNWECAIEIFFRMCKGNASITPDIRNHIQNQLERLTWALRLFKPGFFSREVYLIEDTFWANAVPTIFGRIPVVPIRDAPYKLTADEIAAFLEFFQRCPRTRWAGALDVAMHRFDLSFDRRRWEDRLIDLAVALEALLLRSKESGQSFRLPLRGSALLGTENASRMEAFAMLDKAYDLRSSVVHGDKLTRNALVEISRYGYSNKLDTSQFLGIIENYVRDIIKYVILCQGEPSELIQNMLKDLDKSIIQCEPFSRAAYLGIPQP